MTITVSDAKGDTVHQRTANTAAAANGWTWQRISDSGAKMPDGAYTVGITLNGGKVPLTDIVSLGKTANSSR